MRRRKEKEEKEEGQEKTEDKEENEEKDEEMKEGEGSGRTGGAKPRGHTGGHGYCTCGGAPQYFTLCFIATNLSSHSLSRNGGALKGGGDTSEMGKNVPPHNSATGGR